MGTKKPSRPAPSRKSPDAVSMLVTAVRKGDLRRVKALITANEDLLSAKTVEGTSILLEALYHGQHAIAGFLRSAGVHLSIYDAAACGDRERVEELLAEDPRLIAFCSHDGWTPLHLASFFGHPAVVEFLLDHGADLHEISKNESSVMPLHSALSSRQGETATVLIDRGADIEARQTTYEYTPLHYAAANGMLPIVQRLLDLGAKAAVEGLDGKKPVDLAREKGHRAVVELLERQPSPGGQS